jgi:hypothetical protein
MNKWLLLLTPLPLIAIGLFLFFQPAPSGEENLVAQNQPLTPTNTPTPQPTVSFQKPGNFKELTGSTHVFQRFNNCGPAALSMLLSFYGQNISQEVLGQKLRPYQNPQGDNDDKSVTLPEFAEEAKNYGFTAYYRPNGDVELLKTFLANDIPVVTRTWLKENDDIGHYRIVKGFDENTKEFIQDDSLQGKNLRYSYSSFLKLWQGFNYEYLILVKENQVPLAEAILGEELDEKVAFRNALEKALAEEKADPSNPYPVFNQSINNYYLGNYIASIKDYERISSQLPFRMLWYQIQPIQAYKENKDFQKVFGLTDQILNNHNRAFSELYVIRGEIYQQQNNLPAAKAEYEKAVLYNQNNQSFQQKLNSVN